ncbi:MAG: OmpA family protein [Candidatus Cloacimonetes bacterium]|nr:OmpA family protein [Candidatus Cloacimonadota bacterium]MDY0298443.1 OmpA family protein [Candidatus Cloacimonadaceae bacterium]MCB5279058.1 OmpA family protein [Candidatus Cloacimonadota bacterium]MCK9332184.1 OmpA family protein [Candidatus Cloacimonadota bacterium]MDD2210148.1 OmpA family protein [Candidatus Cloacimonadota bacterium]
MGHLKLSSFFMALIIIMLGACSKNKHAILNEEIGMFSQSIKISTLPTKATIYINEREIGTSPVNYKISHEDSRMINIKAIPIYPNQYTQNIFVMVPPIPKTMTIYMNHYPEDYDRSKESEFIPPKKPDPEIIIQTKIDTIYIEKEVKEILTYNLPAIFFDTDEYDIEATEFEKLEQVADLMQSNTGFFLDIYGFADHRASERYNLSLTLNRAKAVKDFLIAKGVAEHRMKAYGHGKVSKVSSEGIDMDLQQSRKVLFLLKTAQP